MRVTVPADRFPHPPATVPVRSAAGAITQAAVVSCRRDADLLLLEVNADGEVVLPQPRWWERVRTEIVKGRTAQVVRTQTRA